MKIYFVIREKIQFKKKAVYQKFFTDKLPEAEKSKCMRQELNEAFQALFGTDAPANKPLCLERLATKGDKNFLNGAWLERFYIYENRKNEDIKL